MRRSRLSLPVTVKDIQALRQILVNPELCGYSDNPSSIASRQSHHEASHAWLGDGNIVRDRNVVQGGKYILNAGQIRELRFGDKWDETDDDTPRSGKGFEPLPATQYVCPEVNRDISWARRNVGQQFQSAPYIIFRLCLPLVLEDAYAT